jgi:hypothetical protein
MVMDKVQKPISLIFVEYHHTQIVHMLLTIDGDIRITEMFILKGPDDRA